MGHQPPLNLGGPPIPALALGCSCNANTGYQPAPDVISLMSSLFTMVTVNAVAAGQGPVLGGMQWKV